MEQPPSEDRMIRKARKNRAPGRVVRIDLGDGRCAYGRQLWSINAEFYDHVSATEDPVDLLLLVEKPVAFTIWVTDRCFQRNGRWALLDTVPLLERERQRLDVKFRQDMFSGALTIVSRSHPPSVYFSNRPATIEECEGLERDAIWSPEHVEDRLRDHFDGRPNMWVESLRPKPRSGNDL
ncbi:Imm26 family immunity protein [Micromonospora zamorensis]|uniref:Imm26 family immunity protein n=1 Tax=Micromonospora zamorensis TaxID=709883 RepID=UPI003D983EA8